MRESENLSRKFAKTLRRNLTQAETVLWSRLKRHHSHKFRRQHPIGPYIADFACVATQVVIEVDGATHGSDRELARDERRSNYLARNGWRIVRVGNDDVYKRLDDVLEAIEYALRAVPPPPATRAPPP